MLISRSVVLCIPGYYEITKIQQARFGGLPARLFIPFYTADTRKNQRIRQ